MKMKQSKTCKLLILIMIIGINLFLLPELLLAQQWQPQKDHIYLQEISGIIETGQPVLSVAESKGTCYVLTGDGIFRMDNQQLIRDRDAPAGVQRLKVENGEIWALGGDGIYRYRNGSWIKTDSRVYVDLCTHNGVVHAATSEEIFKLQGDAFVSIKPEGGYYSSNMTMMMEDGTQIHVTPVRLGPVNRIQSYSGTLYILRPGSLVLFDGLVVNEDFIDWGSLLSNNQTDMLRYGSRLLIGTDRGLAVLRGAALTTLQGKEGLPVEDITCLEEGFANDVWIGTSRGAIRMVNGDFQYFGADLWLPGNHVNDISAGDSVVYIATDKGLGIIRYESYTLAKKADYFERHLDEWGHKRLGFIHTLLYENGEWIREISDNDGGHTAPYLAAMTYKYAATGDEKAREEAVESFKAMLWLEKIVPIEGFFARAIWSARADKHERSIHGSGGLPAKWYPTPDGNWFWKGDTSSDEVTAHFYSVALFHDLAARGKEKELAKAHLEKIASYIIDCGWTLHDMDGKPTRWGRWDPEYLLRPYGFADRGLNGLEALSFMETAYALTGNEKFRKGSRQLIDWGYHSLTIRQKNVFPPENIAPWDDDLAFESYNILLRYVKDPNLKSVYLRSLERTWEVKRMQKIAWFNFSYGVHSGNDCEEDKAVQRLREWNLIPESRNFNNSHRDDLFVEPGYVSYEGGRKVLSAREVPIDRGSYNVWRLDGGHNGLRVSEPVRYIHDYWMGRYFGLIEAPESNNRHLISVERRPGMQKGAAPYSGPPRPEVF
jgi:hypothetical protein